MLASDTSTGHCVLKPTTLMRLNHRKMCNVILTGTRSKRVTFCVTHLEKNTIAVWHVTILEHKFRMCLGWDLPQFAVSHGLGPGQLLLAK